MTTFITVVITGPTAGDYDRTPCASIEAAFAYVWNLDSTAYAVIELQADDFYWRIDPNMGTYRPFDQMSL